MTLSFLKKVGKALPVVGALVGVFAGGAVGATVEVTAASNAFTGMTSGSAFTGATLTYTLTTDATTTAFATDGVLQTNKDDFRPSNLTLPSGITVTTLVRTSDVVVTVTLAGTPTGGAVSSTNFTFAALAATLFDAGGPITPTGTVPFVIGAGGSASVAVTAASNAFTGMTSGSAFTGATLTYTLTTDATTTAFATDGVLQTNKDDFRPSNLTLPSGITVTTLVRTSDVVVTVTLAGTPTGGAVSSTNFTFAALAATLFDAGGPITPAGTVPFAVAAASPPKKDGNVILQMPTAVTKNVRSATAFTLDAYASTLTGGTLTYAWKSNTTADFGATAGAVVETGTSSTLTRTLTLVSPATDSTRFYQVAITDPGLNSGEKDTKTVVFEVKFGLAAVDVNGRVEIVSKSPSRAIIDIVENTSQTLAVTAVGNGALSYQWQVWDASLQDWDDVASGGSNSTYSVTAASGSYTLGGDNSLKYKVIVADAGLGTSPDEATAEAEFTLEIVDVNMPYQLSWSVVGEGKIKASVTSGADYPAREIFGFQVASGTVITLEAIPGTGKRVKTWNIGDKAFTSGGGNNTTIATYTMGAFDDRISVTFEDDPGAAQFVVNYTQTPTGGKVSASVEGGALGLNPGKPVKVGTAVTFLAEPTPRTVDGVVENAFRVVKWDINASEGVGLKDSAVAVLGADGNYSFTIVVTKDNTKANTSGVGSHAGTITVNPRWEAVPLSWLVRYKSTDAELGSVTAASFTYSGTGNKDTVFTPFADSTKLEGGAKFIVYGQGIGNNRVASWKQGTGSVVTETAFKQAREFAVPTSAATSVEVAFARPVITITQQPVAPTSGITMGSVTASLNVNSNVTQGIDTCYQWYSAPTAEAAGTAIAGATSKTFALPTSLVAGVTYYYYVELGQNVVTDFDGPAARVKSNIVAVTCVPTYATIVAAVQTWLTWNVIKGDNSAEGNVRSDLELPTDSASIVNTGLALPVISGLTTDALRRMALSGVRIGWASSKPGALDGKGVVTRPLFEAADSALVLTATIAKETATATKAFNLTVPKYEDEDYYKLGQVWNSLTWAVIDTNTRASGGRDVNGLRNANVVRNLVLPLVASTANKLAEQAGVTISWTASATGAAVYTYKAGDANKATGEIARLKGGNDVSFDLIAKIEKKDVGTSGISVTKTFKATVPAKEIVRAEFIVFENESKVYNGSVQYPSNARIPSTQVSKFGPMTDTTYAFVGLSALDVGVYPVNVTFEGLDAYSLPRERNLTITRKPLTTASVKLTVDALPAASLIYDGTPKGVAAYTVTDGDADLLRGTHYNAQYRGGDGVTRADGVINAGAGNALEIVGIGNYSGTLSYAYTVTKRSVALDLENCAVAPKVYDGTTAVVKSGITIAVTNLVEGDAAAFNAAKPFNVTGLVYNGANVTTTARVTGAVRLDTAGLLAAQKTVANNYTLAATPSFTKADAVITVKTPDKDDISIGRTLPDSVLRTGTAVAFGTPSFAGGKSNGTGGSLTLQFAYAEGPSAKVPVEVGTYPVIVTVKGGTNPNFVDGDVQMGEWKINRPMSAVISAQSRDTVIRAKNSANLSITATSPNEGTLTYRWFMNDALIAGASSNAYRFTTTAATALGEYNFYALVINAKASGALAQSPDTVKSAVIKVTVDEAAKSIEAARVTVNDQFEYDGSAKIPVEVLVQLGQEQLTPEDFDIEYLNNVNAGMAVVNVTGKNKYEGKATGSFRITQRELVYGEDFDVRAVAVYNGKPQPLQIVPIGGVSGIGPATITYDGAATVPTDAGTYEVVVRFAAGQNYKASDTMSLGDYDILQKLFTEEDLSFSKWPTQVLLADANGIGAVKVRDTTFKDYGTLTVTYGESEAVPTEYGSYPVRVTITGGANYYYAIIPLGAYNIVETIDTVGVKGSDRVIPKPVVTEEAAVAPIAKVAASFTVGPNVARAGETVKFFSSKPVKSGTLYVFDANGNVVAKVSAKSGVGAIGSLLVKSEGTYAVKGALAGKDGTRVKVSTLFTVVR